MRICYHASMTSYFHTYIYTHTHTYICVCRFTANNNVTSVCFWLFENQEKLRPMNLTKICIYIYSLYSIGKLSYTSISTFSSPLAPNIFFCFSNHQGPEFLFFLLLSFQSSVLQWHHEGRNFFSEYDQCNSLFYVGYHLECPLLSYMVKN